MSTPSHNHPYLSADESDEALQKEFVRINSVLTPWPIIRDVILRARADKECEICAIAEAKERGIIQIPPRCPTHYDKSVLTERSVGRFRCDVCGRFLWPRETLRPTEK